VVRERADRETNLEILGTHYERLVAQFDTRPRGMRSTAGGAPLPALTRAGGTN